ncbi:conserved hypothetical protein [Lodderomyces elongisporus NRRL YB-4239]|uniref:Actin interacting protein 3 C-terminal domain-containing protein n=1 Tax=Lodderomyces elongisporus (strain ATCC 11503 / CBS 2605 / JCM 1781 / NBRC 1676 / NRRL YB-4239) TaxID=379508 RepID=A5DT78_LODEL|nr:conserved hypothetical protein [Lodderomyces elongisporus NRRL YB-4239]
MSTHGDNEMTPTSSSSSVNSNINIHNGRVKRKSLSTIESSVTRLLVSTKHLLESLTQWARQEADDKFVSDAYVKLGNDFRAATKAFNNTGIDVSDLGNVPQELRVILEAALGEPPSQESLDRFLPDIRNIIVTLLQNLKLKQNRAKAISNEKMMRGSMESSSSAAESNSIKNVAAPRDHSAEQASSDTSAEGRAAMRKNRYLSPSGAGDQADALTRLQNKDALQRRASKRYSAYQYAKLTNISNPSNYKPYAELVPPPPPTPPQPHSEPQPQPHSEPQPQPHSESQSQLQTQTPPQYSTFDLNPNLSSKSNNIETGSASISRNVPSTIPIHEHAASEGEINVFLQIHSTTKKCQLTVPPTLASIRLQFVEKFAYSPGSDNFPEIYIQDPASKVFYELEEHLLSDVRVGSLLSLKEDEGKLKKEEEREEAMEKENSKQANALSELNAKFESLSQKLGDISNDLVTKIENIKLSTDTPISTNSVAASNTASLSPPSSARTIGGASDSVHGEKGSSSSNTTSILKKELFKVDNELRSIKHLNRLSHESYTNTLASVLGKMKLLQEANLESSQSSNRLYMESCQSKLSDESDKLLTKVDDLQDLMEEVRKDVAQRGVRVGEKQLKYIVKEIQDANKTLQQMSTYITSEKSTWKKIWESELDKVCEEQQFFNLQEDLTRDLQDDLKKIQETFDLVEQCSIEQSRSVSSKRNKVVANIPIPEPGESLHNIKDQVLVDIIQLKPDHESRVEAIERAEKLRQRERELARNDKFQEELGDFVEDGKLKKSGGIEEIENMRKQRDQENLKSSFGII